MDGLGHRAYAHPVDATTMRTLDARLGGLVCNVLTAVEHRRPRRRTPTELRRVVAVKLAEQGATVVAAAGLRRAVELVGADRVHVLVFDENRAILDELDLIPRENVVTIRTGSAGVAATDTVRAVRRLRRLGVDATVDLEFFSRASAALAYVLGAPVRIGFGPTGDPGTQRGDLLTHPVLLDPTAHAADMFGTLFDRLIEVADPPDVPTTGAVHGDRERTDFSSDDLARAQRLLTSVFPEPPRGQVVLLNANTGDLIPQRMWPVDRYVQVARRLLDHDPDLVVAFTGGATERVGAAALVEAVGSPRCASVAGLTTMHDLLALYEVTDLLVTNDSGPAHYSSLTGIHVMTLFGPETPAVFGSRSERSDLLWAGLPCSPCVTAANARRTTCKDNLCMAAHTVDAVVARAIEVLATRKAGARG